MSNRPLVPIPLAALAGHVGRKVHLSWARPGCVWVLVSFTEETAVLRTRKSGKTRHAKTQNLCYTRADEPE